MYRGYRTLAINAKITNGTVNHKTRRSFSFQYFLSKKSDVTVTKIPIQFTYEISQLNIPCKLPTKNVKGC
jgi:hypothetical protein